MSREPVDARGFWLGVLAYGLWGLSPIYWNLLEDVPVMEVLAHRVAWAVPILAGAVWAKRRWQVLTEWGRAPRTLALAVVASAMLAINWGIFIWGVATDHVVEVSLGYFINPLLSVALGVTFLRERLSRAQGIAVTFAVVGVAYMTIRLGSVPWISLVLAASFATYGLLKKQRAAAPALEGLLLETSWLMIPAVVGIVAVTATGNGHLGSSWGTTALLVGAGLITATPLLAFGASAQRIPLSTLGLLQFLAPTLQFLLGVFAYGETVGADRLVGFVLVWTGLAVLSAEGLARRRRLASPVAGR